MGTMDNLDTATINALYQQYAKRAPTAAELKQYNGSNQRIPLTNLLKSGSAGTGTGTTSTTKNPVKPGTPLGSPSSTLDPMALAQSAVKNPNTILTPGMKLANQVTPVDPNAAGTTVDPNDPKYQMDPDALAKQAAQGTAATQKPTATATAATTQGAVNNENVTAAQGAPSQGALIDQNEVNAAGIDINSIASGVNPDGSLNATGQALNDFASLDLNNIDARATTKGQLAILQADFTGPNGEPKIPNYAQGAARAVSRIAAFKGMTGTAATAAMATAMMESSIQVADADAKFYQTVTLQNLSNEQAQTIQKAGILANFEIQNADSRMAAAIQNSQAFLAMDMKNLDNEQQSRVINNQNRIQSILEDAKAENTARLFNAQSQNEKDMFYDNLGSQMSQFNALQTNDMSKFNSDLENNREQFYKSMQFSVDTANAKWRQDVTLHNSNQKFNAAAFDVKNMVDISTEALNQLWDRSDAMLDYIWKSSESAKDRNASLAIANISASTQKDIAKMQQDSADSAGIGEIFGTIAGNVAGSDKFLDWLF